MYDINNVRTAEGIYLAYFDISSLIIKWEVFKTHLMSSNLHTLGLSEPWLNDRLPSDMFLTV